MVRVDVTGLQGLRFMAHVWVIAFHCLRSLTFFDRFIRNCDPGFFFVVSALCTELSLDSSAKREIEDPWKFYFHWVRRRLSHVVIATLLVSGLSYIIFPYPAGAGRDLLPYVFTFTLPWLESFDAKRVTWNPNPPVWFIHQIAFFWLIHPIIRQVLNPVFGNTHKRLAKCSLLVLAPIIALCLWISPRAAKGFTGWSFHPLPRFFQYVGGIWLARFAILQGRESLNVHGWILRMAMRLPASPIAVETALKLLCVYSPDLIFLAYVALQNGGPRRYSDEWMTQWLWRSLGITPYLLALVWSLVMQKSLAPPTDSCTAKAGYAKLRGDDLAISIEQEAPKRSWLGKMFLSRSIGVRIWDSRFIRRIAPGHVNFAGYLIHFPLVWRPFFGKAETARGTRTIEYCLSIWFTGMLINYLSSPHVLQAIRHTLQPVLSCARNCLLCRLPDGWEAVNDHVGSNCNCLDGRSATATNSLKDTRRSRLGAIELADSSAGLLQESR